MNFELSIHRDNQLICKFQNQLKKKDFLKLNSISILGLATVMTINSGNPFINKMLISKEDIYGLLQFLIINGMPITFKNYIACFKNNF